MAIHNTDLKNQPLSQKRNLTQGHQRYMALQEYQGKSADGQHIGTPAWHDFSTNATYDAGPNWSQPPPALPSGDAGAEPRCRPPSQAYRVKYAAIFGHE